MMRTQRKRALALTTTALVGLTVFGWTRFSPALAQNDPANPQPPPGGGRPGRFPFGGGAPALAASGDFVYVLRGNTLYQMKAADLSLVTQKDLPAPAAPAGAAAANP